MARLLILLCIVTGGMIPHQAGCAAERRWPLPDSRVLTGGFADSRPDHFHGGVDLRTYGKALPVIAPTDGWIERFAVSPSGYGRTLYFRLADGNTAVFGHLSRFEPRLESMLRDSQLAVGTYRVDCLFGDSARSCGFRAGETLAYTGSSGIGAPHLHFEIRDGAVQRDPLSFFEPRDASPPVITAVSWTTLGAVSPVSAGKALALERESSGTWRADPIVSEDAVALFVQAYDPGPWGRHAVPTAMRVRRGDRIEYEAECARIDLLGARDLYAKLVWPARRDHRKDVRRLFEFPHPKSGFETPGWLTDVSGELITIEVEDRAGNTASVTLKVTARAPTPREFTPACSSLTAGRFVIETGDDPLAAWAECELLSARELRVGESGFAFGDRHVLTYSFSEGESLPGLYFYERKSSGGRRALWRSAELDSPSSMSCRILRGGVYGVSEDSEPPKLLISGRSGKITFQLTDAESGIDDSSVRCTVDGRTAVAEYEYKEGGGEIWTPCALAKGDHDVEFTAADRAGNERRWNVTVTVR